MLAAFVLLTASIDVFSDLEKAQFLALQSIALLLIALYLKP